MALNRYRIIDDTGVAAGAGSGSGQPIFPDFTADNASTDLAAKTVAHILATCRQAAVRVVNLDSPAGPYTKVIGALATVALTSVPSGVNVA